MELKGTARLLAMQAKSVEELLELAKEHDYSISKEEAEQVFAELSKEGEIVEDELENVAGGACIDKRTGRMVTSPEGKCHKFVAKELRMVSEKEKICANCAHFKVMDNQSVCTNIKRLGK